MRYRNVALRLCAALIVVGASAACGGGGGGGASPGSALLPTLAPSTVPTASVSVPPAAGGRAPATFRVVIPAAGSGASAARSPRYISSATKSIGFTLLKTDAAGAGTGTMQLFPVDATQSYCSSTSAGLACALNLSAPIGNDVYVATTFSDTAGTQRIGSGAVALSVAQNATNSASLTLGGPIASVTLVGDTSGSSYYTQLLYGATPSPAPTGSGTPYPYTYNYVATARLYVLGLDTNKNAIVAPDNFSTPVTLSIVQGYYSYGYSVARRPQGLAPNPTPPPTATPAPATPAPTATPVAIVITVVHRDGSSATTAASGTVQVTAPDDVVTITPTGNTKGANVLSVGVQATVGTVSSPIVSYNVRPALCADNYTGTQPNCVYAPPSPAPLTACAAGQYVAGSPPYQYCAARTFTFPSVTTSVGTIAITSNGSSYPSPGSTALPTQLSSIQFPSISDTRTATVYVNANDPSDTGYIVFTQAGGTCSNLTFTPGLGNPITATSPGQWALAVSINPSPPITGGFQCVISTADPYNTLGAQLTINVNNFTGGVTIQ